MASHHRWRSGIPEKHAQKKIGKKPRGVYELPLRSNIWWVQHFDCDHQRHREKVGRKSDAIDLYNKRKADARAKKKMPDNIRAQGITFKAIAEAGLVWSKAHKGDWKNDDLRIPKLIDAFGSREADSIKPAEMDEYISANAKAPATRTATT